MVEKNAPWRKAEKEYSWSRETDPADLAGDEWVSKGDLGAQDSVAKDDVKESPQQAMLGRFMHPEHDAEY